jgi:hypothetical protein
MKLPVFCISDHTGMTVDAVARSLLAQFPDLEFSCITLPFCDTAAKVREAAARIAATPGALVFSSLTDPALRALLGDAGIPTIDLFESLGPRVEAALGRTATPRGGHTHGMTANYDARIDAVNYTLALDDGLNPQRLGAADLILVGVSRVGKTPTALYLALHYGLAVANYPLTPDDLQSSALPQPLAPHHDKLRGLTLEPERLAVLRAARYPGSRYASLEQCRAEVTAAMRLMHAHAIPVIDTTRLSVEEIAARLRHA